ncbi:helix-turn-helix transcriptional regulator [Streptosporangium sp. NPDC051022]|uniref:helix-turn-helix domain-containing protein n=1 Tax=Streptosporangium sp. NPDC051022 TaxID=3155752 RepID=UPI00344A8DAF
MIGRQSPTVRRRRLSAELRRLRESANMTADAVAEQLEWSRGKLSRIENAQWQRPNPRDVRDLLDVYGVTDQGQREAMIALARESRQRGWWTAYRDILAGSYVDLEAEASAISTFEPLVIPGLLQTPAYAAEITRAALVHDPAEVERRVALRMERQRLLAQADPPRLWAVIDEAALIRPLSSPLIAREQLQRLIDTEPLEHVTIQILPLAAGLHAGMPGQFVIMEFAKDPRIVYVETGTDGLYLEKPEELARYTLVFQHLCATALAPNASLAYISDMIDKLK